MASEGRLTESTEPKSRNGTGSAKTILDAQKSAHKYVCVLDKKVAERQAAKRAEFKPKISAIPASAAKAPKKITLRAPNSSEDKSSNRPPMVTVTNERPAKKSILTVLNERKNGIVDANKTVENRIIVNSPTTKAPPIHLRKLPTREPAKPLVIRPATISNDRFYPQMNSSNANNTGRQFTSSMSQEVAEDFTSLRFEQWDEAFLAGFKYKTPVSEFDHVVDKLVAEYGNDEFVNANLGKMAIAYDREEEGTFDPAVKKINLVALLREAVGILNDPMVNRVIWREDLFQSLMDKEVPWHRVMKIVQTYRNQTNPEYHLNHDKPIAN
uniref:Uncharacterized protein n=1 Tax=Clandestinovirus TaxID=2831644 RepID=A0A8F8PK19_9VIRU|nr:hypothetical protein KOM_12_21 [Clandestinovirus]